MKTIFTINSTDYLFLPVAKEVLKLSEKEIYEEISSAFDTLNRRLEIKNIKYTDLKHALIPNQEMRFYETCLVFNTSMILEDNYGLVIFTKLLPLLGKDGIYSVLSGDYINISDDPTDRLTEYSLLAENLTKSDTTDFDYNAEYYIVYFNRLSKPQHEKIITGLSCFSWFMGYIDLDYCFKLKTYLSCILGHNFIKSKQTILSSHPMDFDDCDNFNMKNYPFQENGFRNISINEESYGLFLSYKIEAYKPDKEDIKFSFNALFPKFNSIDNIKLVIADKRWNKYLTRTDANKKGKGELLHIIGYNKAEKQRFIREVYQKICGNYIYNLCQNDYGDLLFNVCVTFQSTNDRLRKTTIALKYHPDSGTMEIITIT